jgi:hypothetical protein
MIDGYFAAAPGSAIVALVRREAAEECAHGSCPVAPILDWCVCEAVAEFADSRMTAFVPRLALRRERCCIRAGTCDGDDL